MINTPGHYSSAMNAYDRDWGQNFFPLVSPPRKEGKNGTYCFAFKERELLLLNENGTFRLPEIDEFSALGINVVRQQYLGEFNEISCYSMEITDFNSSSAGGDDSTVTYIYSGLRKLDNFLEASLSSIAGKAVHIMEWDKNTIFCGRCGSSTFPKDTERAKQCPECGFTAFPKISPAIIVLIEKGDRVLLARSPHFPQGRYSIIAGFVEPGESIEQAVVREVREEVGISVRNVKYFGSQPWPYPDSLMIGFTAEYLDGDIQVDGIEIEDAGWFLKDEIPNIPGTDSISGQLIAYFIRKHT